MDAVLTLVVVMESLEGRRRADQGEDHIRPAAGDDGDGVAVDLDSCCSTLCTEVMKVRNEGYYTQVLRQATAFEYNPSVIITSATGTASHSARCSTSSVATPSVLALSV